MIIVGSVALHGITNSNLHTGAITMWIGDGADCDVTASAYARVQ